MIHRQVLPRAGSTMLSSPSDYQCLMITHNSIGVLPIVPSSIEQKAHEPCRLHRARVLQPPADNVKNTFLVGYAFVNLILCKRPFLSETRVCNHFPERIATVKTFYPPSHYPTKEIEQTRDKKEKFKSEVAKCQPFITPATYSGMNTFTNRPHH